MLSYKVFCIIIIILIGFFALLYHTLSNNMTKYNCIKNFYTNNVLKLNSINKVYEFTYMKICITQTWGVRIFQPKTQVCNRVGIKL